MPLLDIGAIEGRAQFIRAELGLLQAEPPYSTTLVTERFWPRVPITPDGLPDGITEMVVRDERGRAQLFYSKKVGAPSQRLGIMHGCYHLKSDLALDAGIRECNLSDRRFRQRVVEANPIELACDMFAGAVLVPFQVLDDFHPGEIKFAAPGTDERLAFDAECDRLASRFAVPAGFIRWRLVQLDRLRRVYG